MDAPIPNSTPAAPLDARPVPAQENVLLSLGCNVVAPSLLLTFLSKEHLLGPVGGLIVALSIPLGYGVWDYVRRKKCNIFSILGLTSVLLTGALGLAKADAFWIAVKEAAIPLMIGVAIPLSLRTRQPLVRTLLYNDQVLDTARIQTALVARQNQGAFERLLGRSSYILALSFLGSALLNFYLAKWLLQAPPGTSEFNAQLGRMNFLSWPVIVIPMMGVMIYALFTLLKGVESLTGLKGEELFKQKAGTPSSESASAPAQAPTPTPTLTPTPAAITPRAVTKTPTPTQTSAPTPTRTSKAV